MGQLAAVGNSSVQVNYSFIDAQAPTGSLYYRIKVTDRNGKVAISNVAVLADAIVQAQITVYPNPVKEHLYINVSKPGKYKVDIIASNGQILSSNIYNTMQTAQTIHLNRGNWAAGLFRIAVSNTESAEIAKVFSVLFE